MITSLPKQAFITVYFLDVPLSGLETIKLPCRMKKRGRPKGADKIVIGLIRKNPGKISQCHFYTKVLNKRN